MNVPTTARHKELFLKWKNDTIDQQELQELWVLLQAVEKNDWITMLAETWKEEPIRSRDETAEVLAIVNRALAISLPQASVKPIKTPWFRYAAAILLFAGLGAYWYLRPFAEKRITRTHNAVPVQNDILPGSDRAILTLSNGRSIELKEGSGKLIDSGIVIEKANGELVYRQTDIIVNNTMTTPRGGQYKLSLPDGTKVWLNAASSITYPTSFTGKNREVSITGEAYLEVVKDKEKPFIVKTASDEITVLGTSFNVNVYPDELVSKISLVEGAVKINNEVLRPGEAYSNKEIIKTDIDQDIAWKNGYFNLEKKSLPEIMRQLARWYDIEVVYDSGIPADKLYGEMDRNLTLKDALAGLEGVVAHFKLSGRTVHISPLR